MFEEKDDTILARWLAGQLTEEELLEFQNSEEFEAYQSIANASARFEKPAFDKEKLYNTITSKRDSENPSKVIPLKTWRYAIAIAASLVLIFGFLFNTKTYQTNYGEQLSVVLPDNSEVHLNANSKLSHSRFFWSSNRSVSLEGEGYFKVEKGQTFSVKTNYGLVSVLGTEFNIRSRKSSYQLACYEGKVQFHQTGTNASEILTAGKAIYIENGRILKDSTTALEPSWLKGISTFDNASLKDVLNEIEMQYGLNIVPNNVDMSKRFSGFFVHDNLNEALESVLTPMSISYRLHQNELVLNAP